MVLSKISEVNFKSFTKNISFLQISPQDGLPQVVCNDCLNQIRQSCTFINQCLKVDEDYKEIISGKKLSSIEFEKIEIKECSEDEVEYFCATCKENFDSYYSLTKHYIIHETSKNLTERFQTSQGKFDKKADLKPLSIDIIGLIKEIKIQANLNCNLNFNILKSNSGIFIFSEDDEVSCKYLLDVSMKTTTNEGLCKGKEENINDEENSKIDSDNYEKKLGKICYICNRIFSSDVTLSLHFLKHALLVQSEMDPNIFSQYIFCDVCGITFENVEELYNHQSKSHKQKEKEAWKCNDCKVSFESELQLLIHDKALKHDRNYERDDFLRRDVYDWNLVFLFNNSFYFTEKKRQFTMFSMY